jgi:hypothetical protein
LKSISNKSEYSFRVLTRQIEVFQVVATVGQVYQGLVGEPGAVADLEVAQAGALSRDGRDGPVGEPRAPVEDDLLDLARRTVGVVLCGRGQRRRPAAAAAGDLMLARRRLASAQQLQHSLKKKNPQKEKTWMNIIKYRYIRLNEYSTQ